MQKMSADLNKIIYYSNHIMSNRNELVKRLLSGITNSELQLLENLVRVREEATRPIPTMRGPGEKQDALFLHRAPVRPHHRESNV